MIEKIEIRESLPSDIPSIEKLYPDAFPDEDLLPLVGELLREKPDVVSLVAVDDRILIGNIIFTMCGVDGSKGAVALLAPLAVASTRQQKGIGTALVRAGLQRMEKEGAELVCVLGDPAYYGRFGFEPEGSVAPPYPLPEEWRTAWQSLSLRSDSPRRSGMLLVPLPWRKKALWAP